MKKLILLSGAAMMLASVAFAAPDKDKKKGGTPETIKCAVMTGRDVNIKDATAKKMFADYKGKRYFFCCGGCPGQFKASPDKFAKNASIPTPKDAPKGKKA